MSKRDIGQEVLEGVRAIRRGEDTRREVAEPDAKTARARSGLTQGAFAALLGASPRTLQDCEQGRRKPRGPARSLLRVAERHPEALRG